MKRHSAYVLALLVSGAAVASADETQQFINQQLEMRQQMQANPPVLSFLPKRPGALNQSDQDFIAQLQAKQRQQLQGGETKPVPRAIYFVSFSIPPEGIRQRIADAARLKVPATLRGFVNNSLKDTATVMYDLVKEDQRGGVQVDPTAFSQYGITAVPALVVLCGAQSDRIAGNISLEAMLSKVAEDGDCADVARAILREAEGGE